ncbi:MAG: hypothetical protein Ct9H300mP14_06870 [Gammaproteobacteria bacterium]|nr:MAG: hypothetical protein Ct9H300mP14_06870 [Gammaproteobacteria bacterium]
MHLSFTRQSPGYPPHRCGEEGRRGSRKTDRVKVVKNKVAPPFRQCEFDILYNEGISKEGELIDMGVDHGVVEKSGAWYPMMVTELAKVAIMCVSSCVRIPILPRR